MSERSFLELVGAITVAALITFALLAAFAGPLVEIQRQGAVSMVETCNEQYGPGEWVAVPANFSERGFRMGQMAVCVSESSPRAADCDVAWIFGCDPPESADKIGGTA